MFSEWCAGAITVTVLGIDCAPEEYCSEEFGGGAGAGTYELSKSFLSLLNLDLSLCSALETKYKQETNKIRHLLLNYVYFLTYKIGKMKILK